MAQAAEPTTQKVKRLIRTMLTSLAKTRRMGLMSDDK
jgi:hypothetical protein